MAVRVVANNGARAKSDIFFGPVAATVLVLAEDVTKWNFSSHILARIVSGLLTVRDKLREL